jgi:hypothetical protein
MPPVGFAPKISAGKRPQTYALESADTGTGKSMGVDESENIKGVGGLCVPTGGGVYIDCKVRLSHYRPEQAHRIPGS